MNTIAITIDAPTLKAIDSLRGKGQSRSGIIRTALADYVARRRKAEREAREAQLIERHFKLLNRQAAALIDEQDKT